jgi:DNA-directed RNA polymerase I subunit RPA49
LPADLQFASYHNKASSQLLLHSSDHDTIDFSAVETRTTDTIDAHLKYYVAVYDPSTSRLTVTEAKKVAARSHLRQFEKPREEEEAPEENTRQAARTALTEAFGTKKSRKAVQSIQENRLLARGGEDGEDPVSKAIYSTVDIGDDLDDIDSNPQSNKPLPPANTDTDDIREVYSPDSLVFPAGLKTLRSLPTTYWRDRQKKGKPILTKFHFISNRVGPLLQTKQRTAEDESEAHALIDQQMQILRYIDLLLQLHVLIASLGNRKKIPPAAQWPEGTMSPDLPEGVVRGTIRHFFPDFFPNPTALTLFRATLLALTLHIPPAGSSPHTGTLVSEPTDISQDLGIERDVVNKLYRELGCRLLPMSEQDLGNWGLMKLKGAVDEGGKPLDYKKVKFARLRMPIEFPKVSQGRRQKR